MSTLLLNTLTGKTSAGSIDVTGEGGSTTTNLQQGVAKAWAFADHKTDNAIDNGFNAASLTDDNTGESTLNITNPMQSVTQVVQLTSYRSGAQQISGNDGASMTSTTACDVAINDTGDPNGNYEDSEYGLTIHGDLA